MRQPITSDEFSRLLATIERSAWRLEHQAAYDVGYEDQGFRDFMVGHPTPPTDSPQLVDWFTQVSRHVSEGRTVGRVRVIDTPPTDYQRLMRWTDRWNREAGETIDYLTRAQAVDIGLPVIGDEEWWLLDDARLLVTRYLGGRPSGTVLVDDKADVEQACQWRDFAIRSARALQMQSESCTVRRGEDPPVVFVSQVGTGGKSWQPVVDLLSTGTTTFTYDRPGTGDAPPRPAPNPPLSYGMMADELAAQLDHAGITGPVVVVGHSIGSLIARMFAHRYPWRVAGMVHFDGSEPRRGLTPEWPTNPDGDGQGATKFDALTGEAEVRTAILPRVPAAVVTHTPGGWVNDLPHPALEQIWQMHQRDLADRHGTPLVVARNASHQIPRDAPALTAFVIDEVVQAVRSGTPVVFDLDRLRAADGKLQTP